jgi:hypothetical protein
LTMTQKTTTSTRNTGPYLTDPPTSREYPFRIRVVIKALDSG